MTAGTVHQLEPAVVLITAQALTEAAAAWQQLPSPELVDPALWLYARAEGCTCNDPQECRACGAILCPVCEVGEPAACGHGNGPLCVGCDVEACAGCYVDLVARRRAS